MIAEETLTRSTLGVTGFDASRRGWMSQAEVLGGLAKHREQHQLATARSPWSNRPYGAVGHVEAELIRAQRSQRQSADRLNGAALWRLFETIYSERARGVDGPLIVPSLSKATLISYACKKLAS